MILAFGRYLFGFLLLRPFHCQSFATGNLAELVGSEIIQVAGHRLCRCPIHQLASLHFHVIKDAHRLLLAERRVADHRQLLSIRLELNPEKIGVIIILSSPVRLCSLWLRGSESRAMEVSIALSICLSGHEGFEQLLEAISELTHGTRCDAEGGGDFAGGRSFQK